MSARDLILPVIQFWLGVCLLPFILWLIATTSMLSILFLLNATGWTIAWHLTGRFFSWLAGYRAEHSATVAAEIARLKAQGRRQWEETRPPRHPGLTPLMPDFSSEYPPLREKAVKAWCASNKTAPPVKVRNDDEFSSKWRHTFAVTGDALETELNTATSQPIATQALGSESAVISRTAWKKNDLHLSSTEDASETEQTTDLQCSSPSWDGHEVAADPTVFGMLPSQGIARDFETLGGYQFRPYTEEDLAQFDALNGRISLYPDYHRYEHVKNWKLATPKTPVCPGTPVSPISAGNIGKLASPSLHGEDHLAALVRNIHEVAASRRHSSLSLNRLAADNTTEDITNTIPVASYAVPASNQ